MQVQVILTKAQAAAVLRAGLSAGYGVRRSAALVEADRRIKDAIRAAQEQGITQLAPLPGNA